MTRQHEMLQNFTVLPLWVEVSTLNISDSTSVLTTNIIRTITNEKEKVRDGGGYNKVIGTANN